MLHKCLAAILLLPASFVVHGSLKAWLRALVHGKKAFYAPVVKHAPAKVGRPPSFVRRLPVYYPMKAGLELLRSGSLTPVVGKAMKVILRRRSPAPDVRRNSADIWIDHRPPFLSLERMLALVATRNGYTARSFTLQAAHTL